MTSVFVYSAGFVLMLGGTPNPGARSAPLRTLVEVQGAQDDTVQQIARLIEAQDLPAAKAAVDSALRAEPTNPVLQNYAGIIEAQRGAFEVAELHFQTAIQLAPRSPGPYENLGRFYQERSGADPEAGGKALRTYRSLLAVDPTNREGLYQLAFLQALAGQFSESRTLLDRLPGDLRARPQVLAVLAVDQAAQRDPQSMTTAATLASHPELKAADILAVLPAFDRLKDDAVAQRLLEALDRREMATPEVLQALGRLYARHDRFAEGRATLERAAASGVTVPLLLDLARAAFKGGDREGALGYLAHARSLEPNNASVHFMFGIVCVELNLGAEAYESLKKAVALDPENPMINYTMGAVSTQRHEPAEAIPYFEKYVALKPSDPRGRFALGAGRFYAGQFEEARDDLQKAAANRETAAGAHYFLARIARQSNDLPSARREIDAALRSNSTDADVWAELGLIQLRTTQYAEAERSLAKSLALDPMNYAANVNLATLYSRTKDPRREAQTARLQELQQKREAQAQEFLRIVQVAP